MPRKQKRPLKTVPLPKTGQEVYRAFMAAVEPDLLPENLERLDGLYPGESEEQHTWRYGRYAIALRLFQEYLKDIENDIVCSSIVIKGIIDDSTKLKTRHEEKKQLKDLERKIDTSPAP